MKATFAAGCFWGVEEAFSRIPGVLSSRVGYIGGSKSEPGYREVCTGETGHAEAVEIDFDESLVSFEDLLNAFWRLHDPTTLNRQGPDIGTQYRSAIFHHNEAQRLQALASMEREAASGRHQRPVVTEVAAASAFWPAEEYHQRYLAKRGLPGCHL